MRAYGTSKLATLLFTTELARRSRRGMVNKNRVSAE